MVGAKRVSRRASEPIPTSRFQEVLNHCALGHPIQNKCFKTYRRLSKPVQEVILNVPEKPQIPCSRRTTGVTSPLYHPKSIISFSFLFLNLHYHFHFQSAFLGAPKHLYKRVCLSVRPSVGPSVRPSVGPSVRPSVGPSVGP